MRILNRVENQKAESIDSAHF